MGSLVHHITRPVSAAASASRHLLWYLSHQLGAAPREL
jgi:hypothetical protein